MGSSGIVNVRIANSVCRSEKHVHLRTCIASNTVEPEPAITSTFNASNLIGILVYNNYIELKLAVLVNLSICYTPLTTESCFANIDSIVVP